MSRIRTRREPVSAESWEPEPSARERAGAGGTGTGGPASVLLYLPRGREPLGHRYGLNSVVHQSLFRQAYEQFFTSVPSSEQRTFKPIADSFFNRLGAAGGAGLIALLTLLAPARVYPGLLLSAVLCAAGAVLLAGPMNRICISTLERGLLRRALELDLDERRRHLDADRRTPPELQRRGGAQPR